MKLLARLRDWVRGLMGDRNTGFSSFSSTSQRLPEGGSGPIIAPQTRR